MTFDTLPGTQLTTVKVVADTLDMEWTDAFKLIKKRADSQQTKAYAVGDLKQYDSDTLYEFGIYPSTKKVLLIHESDFDKLIDKKQVRTNNDSKDVKTKKGECINQKPKEFFEYLYENRSVVERVIDIFKQ